MVVPGGGGGVWNYSARRAGRLRLREDQMGEKGGEGCVLGKSWGVLRGLAPFGLGEHGCGVVHYNNGAVTSSRLLRFNVTGSRFKFDLSNFFFFFSTF